MPLYEYQAAGAEHCPACEEPFEVVQPMGAEPLARCERCGAAVRRLLSFPAIHRASGRPISDRHLADAGFTKYEKAEGGRYDKVCGTGPETIGR